MDITPKKKKVVIKVKPHTIHVGEKKPSNGGKGTETPVPVTSLKKPLWKRCVEVIKEDLHFRKVETDALLHDDPSWEEYLRFKEMAMKGKK